MYIIIYIYIYIYIYIHIYIYTYIHIYVIYKIYKSKNNFCVAVLISFQSRSFRKTMRMCSSILDLPV